jgi:hypothetical protein
MNRRALSALVVTPAILAGSAMFVVHADEEQFKSLFREGVEAYKRGNPEEAYTKLEQALRIKIDSSLVLYMRDEVGYAILQRMMMDGGKIRETALRILELAKGRSESFKRDDAAREELVMQLDTPDGPGSFEKVQEARYKLMNCGTWACDNLVRHLGDTKSEKLRTEVVVTLTYMSTEATIAVAEALNSTDKLTQQNACVVLGNIADIRGLGELRRVIEDGAIDAEVKTFAQQAVDRILKAHPEETVFAGKSAKETLVALAERHYRQHPSVMHFMFGDYVVWRWSKEANKLVGREVPPWALNEELAEEALHDAIGIDNAYLDAWALLACVSFAQYEEALIAIEDAAAKFNAGEISAEDNDKLKADFAKIEQAAFLGQMTGKEALFKALSRSLADDTSMVSVHLCRALAKAAKWEDLPRGGDSVGSPLSEALKNGDSRVRYAASEAVVALRPQEKITNYEMVIPNLADAVTQQATRVVLIIEANDDTRNRMMETYRGCGYYVLGAATAKDGIMKTKAFPNQDLIVCDGTTLQTVVFSVNILGKSQAEESVLDSFKQDIRTKNIPLVVSAGDQKGLDDWKAIFKDEVQGYILNGEDVGAVKAFVDPLTAGTMSRSKMRAEATAISAAQALASIRIQDTIFDNYATATPKLCEALDGRPDTIRIPACWALGALGDAGGCDALSKVLADAGNSPEVRVAAAEGGLQGVFRQSGAAPSGDHVGALTAGITDDNWDVNRATSKAIGAAALTAEQRAAIFMAERLHQLK